jgi:putative ABC transport system permease protein
MFNESIKMAIEGMIANKMRTFLTLLGIIIGVGAVIAMVSLGFGVKEQVKNNISRLGSNLLIVQSGGRTATGASIQAGSGARLTYEDAQAIEKNVDDILYVAPMVSKGYQVVAGNQNWTTNVQGATPNILNIRDYTLEEGRNYNTRDMTSRDRVCVIGKTIVENLFPEGNPVGKSIRINKAPFTVIGVLAAKGQSSMGQDQDDVIFVPLTTAMNRLMGITYVNNITIQAKNENVVDSVQGEVEQILPDPS